MGTIGFCVYISDGWWGHLVFAYTLVMGDGDNWILRIHKCWVMETLGICVYISVGWWGELVFAYTLAFGDGDNWYLRIH